MGQRQGRHTSIIGPRTKQCIGAPTYTNTHRNKSVIVDKIKHIFIKLVLPTKSVLKTLKKHAVHNIHRLEWEPMVVGPRANAQRAHVLRRHWSMAILNQTSTTRGCKIRQV
jgi:hypothetical protein